MVTVVRRVRPRRRRRSRRRRRASRMVVVSNGSRAQQSQALVPYRARGGPIVEEPGEVLINPARYTTNMVPRPPVRTNRRQCSHAALFCANLLRGKAYSHPELPCAHAVPFQEMIVKRTFQLTMAADGTYAGIVFNPHAMYTDVMQMATSVSSSGAVLSSCSFPTSYAISSTTLGPDSIPVTAEGFYNGSVANPGAGEGYMQNSTSGASCLAGQVRFICGEACVKTFETWQNTGGRLYYVSNLQDRSLLGFSGAQGSATNTVSGVVINAVNTTQVLSTRNATHMKAVTAEPTCFAVLPHTTEFKYQDTGLYGTAGSSSTAIPLSTLAYEDTVQKIQQFIPDNIGCVNNQGWTQAIIYAPANAHAASTAANCEIELTMHYHVNTQYANTSGGTTWQVSEPTQTRLTGVSDARSASAMQAAIDGIKQARTVTPQAAFNDGSRSDSLLSHVPSILAKIARAAPEIALEVAGLLPEGSRQRGLLEGFGRVGKIITG